MESQVGNMIQDQNIHFKGASAGGKNIFAKAPRKEALSRRKPLGDLSNSIQPTPNRSIKKQNSSMFSFTEKETEEDLDAICEEDFPMQPSASSSKVVMDNLLSEDEFPWKHEEFSDHDSLPPCRSYPKSQNHFMMWDEDTIDDFDIMSFESPNLTLIESP
ncbi:hypothetical protein EZV62_005916 [Acer yangbiense]|uniref:Uncharacterized protein n=1 Tax=Acer yangbiense TaxID=1000413 RepID=A0A5C7INY9_9ROSI|nr:hypothetical protein EZV62_005916 [Acer yangbiense]